MKVKMCIVGWKNNVKNVFPLSKTLFLCLGYAVTEESDVKNFAENVNAQTYISYTIILYLSYDQKYAEVVISFTQLSDGFLYR